MMPPRPHLPLYPFQTVGAEFLRARPLAWLADEMGLGKTVQVIRAAEGSPYTRNLVVCPPVVRGVWVRELEKWSLLDPFVREIRSGKAATYLEARGTGWWIVSYPYARKYWRRFVGLVDRVIFDEVHALRNLRAKQTHELLGFEGLAHHMKSVWALTGTPSPNHPGELWPILSTLGALPEDGRSYPDFCRNYCILSSTGTPIALRGGVYADHLKGCLGRVMLRRTKNQVGLQLPPITRSVVWVRGVDPSPEELAASTLGRFAPDELELTLQEDRVKAEAAIENARFDILSSGVSTLRAWIALRKRKPLLDMLAEEARTGQYDKLLVFGMHRDLVRWLSNQLPARSGSEVIDGSVSHPERERILGRWQEGETNTIVGNIHSMGTGLTLTEANQVVNAEPWWNEDINDQALARAHRIGQLRPVTYRYVMLEDEPFESSLLGILKRKKDYNNSLWS